MTDANNLTVKEIQGHIVHLPNRPPSMIASQLARIYEVNTSQINQAVRRNPDRFPDDFCFYATQAEVDLMVSQNVIPTGSLGGHLPRMFTRYGANQLSTVLKSKVAARRSVQIMRAFSLIEEAAGGSAYRQDECEPTPDNMMLIEKDEYIALLRDKITMLELQQPRKNRPPRPFTDRDRAEIMRLKREGYSQREISEIMDRSGALISMTLRDCPDEVQQ